MKRHFVVFYSPGTFVAETTERPIDEWDVRIAVDMSRRVIERHAARPYGFRFITRSRGTHDLDSKETKRSGMYYLGGTIETLQQIEARNNPDERILCSNMRGNGWDRVVTNRNSWKWTQPLHDGDVVLDLSEFATPEPSR